MCSGQCKNCKCKTEDEAKENQRFQCKIVVDLDIKKGADQADVAKMLAEAINEASLESIEVVDVMEVYRLVK